MTRYGRLVSYSNRLHTWSKTGLSVHSWVTYCEVLYSFLALMTMEWNGMTEWPFVWKICKCQGILQLSGKCGFYI